MLIEKYFVVNYLFLVRLINSFLIPPGLALQMKLNFLPSLFGNENKQTCLSSKILEQNNQRLEEICHQLAVEKNASISSSTTNSSSTTYYSNSSTSSSGSTFDYTIRMAKGAGIHLGLSFIVKDIKCGWLNAAGFEGSRVKYLEHEILFQLSKIEQCCNQLHSIS